MGRRSGIKKSDILVTFPEWRAGGRGNGSDVGLFKRKTPGQEAGRSIESGLRPLDQARADLEIRVS